MITRAASNRIRAYWDVENNRWEFDLIDTTGHRRSAPEFFMQADQRVNDIHCGWSRRAADLVANLLSGMYPWAIIEVED